jgi:hypothetical protein
VKSGRVFVADGNYYFNRSGPRVVESAEMLAEMFWPELLGLFGHHGNGFATLEGAMAKMEAAGKSLPTVSRMSGGKEFSPRRPFVAARLGPHVAPPPLFFLEGLWFCFLTYPVFFLGYTAITAIYFLLPVYLLFSVIHLVYIFFSSTFLFVFAHGGGCSVC